MARHKHYEPAEDADPALDISSLIDVCFLLLIYFLVTSTIKPKESDLDLHLASRESEEIQPHIVPLLIKVETDNTVSVGIGSTQQLLDTDPDLRELPVLCSWLDIYAAAARSAFNQPLVQLWVADGASQQRVVDVLNALASKGIHNVAFTDLGT
jgi:biopolymer transport protein ExbD